MTYEEQVRRQLEAAQSACPISEDVDAAFGGYGMQGPFRFPVGARKVKQGKRLKRALKQAGGYTVNIVRRRV